MNSPEVYSIGAVALALVGLVYKIWREHTELSKQMIEIIRQNAVSHEVLSGNIRELSKNVSENTQITKNTGDVLTKLMYKVLIRNKHK